MEDRTAESYLLNGLDIKRLSGDCPIFEYPALEQFDSIEELFNQYPKGVILLYLQDKDDNSATGHWSGLLPIYDNRDNLKGAEFYCSYGLMPDSAINWIPTGLNRQLGQTAPFLSRLLLDFKKKGGQVLFNEKRHQHKGDDIATCGRHSGVRLRYGRIPLKQYQNLIEKYKCDGWNTDELITELSNYLLDF